MARLRHMELRPKPCLDWPWLEAGAPHLVWPYIATTTSPHHESCSYDRLPVEYIICRSSHYTSCKTPGTTRASLIDVVKACIMGRQLASWRMKSITVLIRGRAITWRPWQEASVPPAAIHDCLIPQLPICISLPGNRVCFVDKRKKW